MTWTIPIDSPSAPPNWQLHTPQTGQPDWPTLAREAAAIAADVLPRLERPQTGLALHKRRLRAWRTAAANYLHNRRLAKAGREDLRPLYFIWTVLRTCNFLCTYCDDHRGRKYPELSTEGTLNTEDALRLLRVMRTGTPSLYFAGGEPTLRKDLPELTRAARDLAYHPILINTNGSAIDRLLRKPAWRTWLADTDIVIVSLDGLDLDMLGRTWVYKKPQDVLRNLLVLRELAGPMDFKLMVNTVIQPGATEHARAVLDLANDLGIWFCPVPLNEGAEVSAGLAADPKWPALRQTILARKRAGHRISGSQRMNERMLNSAPLDCRNTLKPHIDHDGHLFWPCKAAVNTGPERINVLDFEHIDAIWRRGCSLIDPTRFHGPGPEQCGGDCNWAQNYTTDAYAHGLRHPTSLLGEVVDFLRNP